MRWYFERISRNTTDDHFADGQALLERPAFEVARLVLDFLQSCASAEHLNTGDIDAVDFCAIVGQKGRKRASDNLTPVDDCDTFAEETFAVVEKVVVDLKVLQDLNNSEGRARQDRLPQVVGRIQEANVLIHVADELWRETFDIFVHADSPLECLISSGIEDRIVNDYPVDFRVGVGLANLVLQILTFDLTEDKVNSTCRKSAKIDMSIRLKSTYFSLHVLAVQSAYMRAAGSLFARNPWSRGVRANVLISAVTCSSRLLAMELASTTLQDPEDVVVVALMTGGADIAAGS